MGKFCRIRKEREKKDREDFHLVLKAYNQRGYSKGARDIYMCMAHWAPPVVMNLKKIRRLMDKNGLLCSIRKANPYRRMAKALKTGKVVGNFLKRKFTEYGLRFVLETVKKLIKNYGIELTKKAVHVKESQLLG